MIRQELMGSRRVRHGVVVLVVLLLLVAWLDGGREPQRMIEQEVALPLASGGGAGR